jgi:hypothetical protein
MAVDDAADHLALRDWISADGALRVCVERPQIRCRVAASVDT